MFTFVHFCVLLCGFVAAAHPARAALSRRKSSPPPKSAATPATTSAAAEINTTYNVTELIGELYDKLRTAPFEATYAAAAATRFNERSAHPTDDFLERDQLELAFVRAAGAAATYYTAQTPYLASLPDDQLDFSNANVAEAIVAECAAMDVLRVFMSRRCREAVAHYLATAEVLGVDMIESPPPAHGVSQGNGAFRVTFGKLRAQFKSCSTIRGQLHESYKAELIAHGVDRLLGVRRVPVVVPRRFALSELLRAVRRAGPAGKHRRQKQRAADAIKRIYLACAPAAQPQAAAAAAKSRRNKHSGKVDYAHAFLDGALMQWTSKPLESMEAFGDTFLVNSVFRPAHILLRELEFVRLILHVFSTNRGRKFDHNIMIVANAQTPQHSTTTTTAPAGAAGATSSPAAGKVSAVHTRMALAAIDNDRASWHKFNTALNFRNGSICSRSPREPAFHCAFPGVIPSTADLLLFLAQACLFPQSVATALEAQAAPNATPFSLLLAEHMEINARHGADKNATHLLTAEERATESYAAVWTNHSFGALQYQFYDSAVLDMEVRLLVASLQRCLQQYKRSEVIFDDDIY